MMTKSIQSRDRRFESLDAMVPRGAGGEIERLSRITPNQAFCRRSSSMKQLSAILLTASLALAFFVASNTPVFAQVAQVQESVIVTTPAPVVKGSPGDHFLSFNVPVAIPGVALAPGSYIFRRPVDSAGSVIQVLSADRRHVYALLNTMPAFRARLTNHDEIVFGETHSGSPIPIKEWFLAERSIGYRLMYRKETDASASIGN
jgi:hypothetical protein